MRIKSRLALVAGVPLVLLVTFALQSIFTSLSVLSSARTADQSIQIAEAASGLIEELQRERGLSAAYYSAEGLEFAGQLEQQRQSTDVAISAFEAFASENNPAVRTAEAALSDLAQIRRAVDRFEADVNESTVVYRSMVDAQLDLVRIKMARLTERGLGDEPGAYIALLRTTEMSGLERSMGAAGFADNGFTIEKYRQYLEYRGAQSAILEPVLKTLPPEIGREAESYLRGEKARDVLELRRIADASGANAPLPEGLAQDWFNAATARISGLSDVGTSVAGVLRERVDAIMGDALRGLAMTIAIALIGVIGTAYFASWSAMDIVRVVTRLSSSLKRIGKHDYGFNVAGVKRKDELGDMARSLLDVREQLKAGEAVNIEATYKGAGFDGSSIAMMIIDRDFNVIYVNEASRKFLTDSADVFKSEFPHFDPDAIVGTCIDIFHKNPEHQRKMLSDPSRLPFKTEIVVGEMRISLNVSAVYGRDGEYIGNTLEWLDVTEMRLNEGILKAIDRTQAKIEFDLKGNILNANENFLSASGYQLKDLVGRHHRIFCPEEIMNSSEYAEFWRRLEKGEHTSGRIERRHKNGGQVFLDASYSPVLDGSGHPFKVVKIATDVTKDEQERRESEERRQQRSKDLAVVVENLASGLARISGGDFSEKIDAAFAEEYIALKDDFNAAVEKLASADRQQKESKAAQDLVVSHLDRVLTKLSDRDLSIRMEEEFEEAYEDMRTNFNGALEDLMTAMRLVDATGDDIKNGATELSGASDELSQRTERQSATLEETAAAITQITATVAQSAKGAKDVSEIVQETKDQAQKSGKIVNDAVDAMGRIKDSSNSISSIINVIDDIAFQTNLLALNAGVEAARAGDAGKGFAVVAQEVRALAQRSAEAAKEIKGLISSSANNVSDGVELVNSTGEALQEIVARIDQISSLAYEIATSSQEQSEALDQVTQAVTELDSVTQQNAAMVEETTAASHKMRDNALQLADMMAGFSLGVEPDEAKAKEAKAPRQPAVHHQPAVKQQQARATAFIANGSAAVDIHAQQADDDWQDF